jgi:predicted HTH domain antitoxin
MKTVQVQVPEEVFAILRKLPAEFPRELLLSAVVHWFQQGLISGGKAADILGMHRMDFYDELARRGIDVIQVDTEELKRDLAHG